MLTLSLVNMSSRPPATTPRRATRWPRPAAAHARPNSSIGWAWNARSAAGHRPQLIHHGCKVFSGVDHKLRHRAHTSMSIPFFLSSANTMAAVGIVVPNRNRFVGRSPNLPGFTATTSTKAAVASRQATLRYSFRALPRSKRLTPRTVTSTLKRMRLANPLHQHQSKIG